MKFKSTLLALFIIASALALGSCRSRASKSKTASSKTKPAQTATTTGPSSQQVMSKADSVLAKVNALSQEPRDMPPPVMADDYPKTPWGSNIIPKPDLTAYSTYEAGLGNYTNGEYEKAIGDFSDVVVNGRPIEAVPGAYYWMGECYFAMERFAESLPYFEYTVKAGPTFKRESALYKLARANNSMGNSQAAGMWYERLMTEYPKSSYGAKLKKLGVR
ncbi:MAG: tetratricopeptide repeat protein [bacterium]